MSAIIIENIRSAYNVGNIIRTADALGRDVIISGYSPSPATNPKVGKTSLGAENKVKISEFTDPNMAIDYAKSNDYLIISAEKTENSIDLNYFSDKIMPGIKTQKKSICLIVGNEVEGVLKSSLEKSDYVVHIPMLGSKESLNVGQASAIFMWEFTD